MTAQKIKAHAQPLDALLNDLNTSQKGLSATVANEKLHNHGKNELPAAAKKSEWVRFFMQFHNVLIYVLIAASVITALLEDWVDTGVIWGVILINALIGYIQEGKAESALEALKKMLSLNALVLRDEKKMQISATELVPGDIVFLKAGDRIPADMRLVEAHSLKSEEAALTGESVPSSKKVDTLPADTLLADQHNMLFSGCAITFGNGVGVVTATGSETELGRINKMLDDVDQLTTPLLRQINAFGKTLSFVIMGLAGAFFLFGYFVQNYTLEDIFPAVIGLAVAAIPEGLPALMTIVLALGVQQMARKNAIIRKLPSVETLGAVNTICSDKTGTLTKNEMTVSSLQTADNHYAVTGTGYEPKGNITKEKEKVTDLAQYADLQHLLLAFSQCNDATIEKRGAAWTLTGEPTEGALITVGMKAQIAPGKLKRHATLPFDSAHKYMAIATTLENDQCVYLIKGAPEKLIEMSAKQFIASGEHEAIDPDFWNAKIEAHAGEGERIIAAAIKVVDKSKTTNIDHRDLTELTFLGIAGLMDPPRDEVYDAIAQCKSAGIQVKMITGDHVLTAQSIGEKLGIAEKGLAMTGQEIEAATDEELATKVLDTHIFARATPEHKLRLVTALQTRNQVVAMTGDGVNDAPALKRADVGIAMGIKGTEVTKEAADMVLTDDNFASITAAVKEGRTTYENLKKAILFMLPTNGAEALVIMAALILGQSLPITAAQILWVNMITAVTLGIALAFEPSEPVVMQRKPRNSSAAILDGYLVWRIVFVSSLIALAVYLTYRAMRDANIEIEIARTVAVNILVACEALYLLNCRFTYYPTIGKGFFSNPYAFLAIGVLAVFQLLFTYLPAFNYLFDTAPIKGQYWGWIIGYAVALFILVEIEKRLMRSTGKKKAQTSGAK
ncbi:MAG: cation-transporting P-type ATPase [Schleiferiaceae bacterium]|nr:cation-transporting P-type ATPase [Schleiferiaceae bacterium]